MTDELKPAFLYPGMGKRKKNDREASAGMPFQAARGYVAGTLGLPGDIESLLRTLIHAGATKGSSIDKNMDTHSRLPTSEFYREWLPLGTDKPGGKAAGELGNLFGGLGVGTAASGIATGGGAVLKHGAKQVARAMEGQGPLARALAPIQPSYTVKPKGGNWLDGASYQEGLGPEDTVSALAMDHGGAPDEWSRKQLVRYLKNEFGTPSDPLLRLEQEGRLHFDPQDVLNGGYLGPGMGVGPLKMAKHKALTGRDTMTPYEKVSAADIQEMPSQMLRRSLIDEVGQDVHGEDYWTMHNQPEDMAQALRSFGDGEYLIKNNEWLDKVPDDTPVHSFNPSFQSDDPMQWNHVLDYLSAASDAHTNLTGLGSLEAMRALPEFANDAELIARNLHLSPEQIQRTSVADAVAKTSEWNKLLAKQTQLQDINNGIKQVHKQYPDGHQWVELSPEGLKAEGQAMRHCVGGYCNSVENGSTRILSLRNGEGQPRVTVEVGGPQYLDTFLKTQKDPDGLYSDLHERVQSERAGNGDYELYARDLLGRLGIKPPAVINQIKGPANRAPSYEVLPHVQDLVRNGLGEDLKDWHTVRDLRNTGLHDTLANNGAAGLPWDHTHQNISAHTENVFNRFNGGNQNAPIWNPIGQSSASLPDRVINAYRDEALGGARYGTQDEWNNWVEGLGKGEQQ